MRSIRPQASSVACAAAVSEAKDYYVPNLSLGGGLGRSYGITLTVPTIFTVNSQSLVYSPMQRDYIRGAKSAVESSKYALQDVRQQVEESKLAARYAELMACR